MTGAQSLVRSLEEVGCEVVFGIPGGTILPAYDPLLDSTRVRHVLVRHEQGAGHAATGYAQATGKVGVCMATSGPGATNLVTPIADAHMDSVPMVAITGQQTRALIGTDAFQEADITGITMPITKHNMLVTDADGDPAGDRGGVPPGQHRPTRPGAGGHPEGRAAGADHLHLAAGDAAARLPADDPAARQADPRGGQADLRGRASRCSTSAAACSRRRPRRELLRAGRAHRHPGGHHADGARRVPGQPPAARRACPACTARWPRWPPCSAPTCWSRSAPGSTTGSPASCPASRRTRRSCTPTSTRRRSPRTAGPTCRSSATARRSSSS